jgi:hypothetical protein
VIAGSVVSPCAGSPPKAAVSRGRKIVDEISGYTQNPPCDLNGDNYARAGGQASSSSSSFVPQHTRGCPSIREKALSRKNYPWRCVSITMLAREVEDEDSGKHLILNHPFVERFCCCFCRSTNHRFGPTAAMILLFEHPTQLGARAPNQSFGWFLASQGHPRAALDANDLWISRVGA